MATYSSSIFSNFSAAIEKAREVACLVERCEYMQKEAFPEIHREEGGMPLFVLDTSHTPAGSSEEPNALDPTCMEWEEWGESCTAEIYQETSEGRKLVWALRKYGYHNSGFYFKEA